MTETALDKDKALPLVRNGFPGEAPYLVKGPFRGGSEAQRDADWERIKPLVKALEAIWDEFDPAAMTPVGRQARDVLHQLGVEVKP